MDVENESEAGHTIKSLFEAVKQDLMGVDPLLQISDMKRDHSAHG